MEQPGSFLDKLLRLGKIDPSLSSSLSALAQVKFAQGHLTVATEIATRALALAEQLGEFHRIVAPVAFLMAFCLLAWRSGCVASEYENKSAEAETLLCRALVIFQTMYDGTCHVKVASVLSCLIEMARSSQCHPTSILQRSVRAQLPHCRSSPGVLQCILHQLH